MILHFLTDDKFADYAIKQFSAPEMHSDFICLDTAGRMDLVELRSQVRVMYPYSDAFVSFLKENLGKYDGIVLHGMCWGQWQKIILQLVPNNVKVAWYFWGGEIYSRKELTTTFMAPLTKLIYRLHDTYKHDYPNSDWELPFELYQRVDYCLTAEQEEYEYARAYTRNSMEYIWYTCYSIEETIGKLIDQRVKGGNVLFCNSASIKNNMFDATFRMVRRGYRKHLRNRKIIMPLSYGDKWVKNLMVKIGPKCFDQFEPLLELLPRDEYNAKMLDCSTMILTYRQPAGQGNVITGLWLGMRVYLSEKSIAYRFFKRIGVKIFSFESDFETYGCTAMTDEEINFNRKVLREMFSREQVMRSAKNVVSILEGKKNGK